MTPPAPVRPRPNVLLVTLDQWRADSLSCAGHRCARTPNIDALAARGVRFARHYAQAAPCGPSRASLLTGTYLHTHRSVANHAPLDASLTNVALEMNAAGYHSTLFGYTDTTADPATIDDPADPRLRSYQSILPGFAAEVDLPDELEPWGEWLRARGHHAPAGAVERSMYRRQDLPEAGGRGATWAPTIYPAEHSEAAFLVERFGEWLDRQDEAWFAHVTFLRPHPPYMAPAPWHDLVDPSDVPAPMRHATVQEEGTQHPLIAAALGNHHSAAPDNDLDQRQFQATYWGMLGEVDDQFGSLLATIERAGATGDTLVILTSDHGEQLGDHWLRQKLGFFDQSYHVPLIVAGPGVTAPGHVVDDFTESIDLMPTILAAVGAGVPAQCQGRPLQPFFGGRRPDTWRDAVHWEWDFRDWLAGTPGDELRAANLAVIRDAHGKYVHFGNLPPIFYDLDADPGELHNIADEPDAAARMQGYAQRLLSWRLGNDDDRLASLRSGPDGMGPV